MKKIGLGILIGITVLGLSLSLAIAQGKPNGGNNKAQAPEIEKMMFVHYPVGHLPDPGGDPTDKCGAHYVTGIKWGVSAVTYDVDEGTVPGDLSVSNVKTDIGVAFTAWETQPSAVWGRPAVTIDFNEGTSLHTIMWEDISEDYPEAIAVTIIQYYTATGLIISVDTVMNSTLAWSTTGASGTFDVQNIMTHEAGHWLVLGDLYAPGQQALTMYGLSATGETQKQTLGRGDALGIDRIY